MRASAVIQQIFNYLKSNSLITPLGAEVSVCDLKEGDSLSKPLIVVLPIRDPIAGEFVTQERESLEIGISCYSPEFYAIASPGQLDERVHTVMRQWEPSPTNFHLVRRFYTRWVKPISAFQSQQIYSFHFRNVEDIKL